ncbi:unnamed protein product, partial [Prorocentrum cordatum]
ARWRRLRGQRSRRRPSPPRRRHRPSPPLAPGCCCGRPDGARRSASAPPTAPRGAESRRGAPCSRRRGRWAGCWSRCCRCWCGPRARPRGRCG